MMLPKKSFPKSKKLFSLLLLPILFLGLAWWLVSRVWVFRQVDCQADNQPCSFSLWSEAMSKVNDKSYLFFSRSKLSQEIEKNHPEISQVEIKKSFPRTLVIKISIGKPIAVVRDSSGNEKILSAEGVFLPKQEGYPVLPIILTDQSLSTNDVERTQNKSILKAVKILEESQLRLFEIKSGRIVSESTIEFELKEGPLVLFSTQKDLENQLDSLQLISERAKIEGEKPVRIDLRFSKPVIVS